MSKSVIAQQGNAVSTQLKDLQSEFSEAITIRKDLIKIPRLKLDNALSNAVQGGISKSGDFSCAVRGITYGPKVTIIPLVISESASLLDKHSGDVLCSSDDLIRNRKGEFCKQCPFDSYWNDWGTKEERKTPNCKNSIDMIVIVNPFAEITIMQLSFRKNNFKAGKALVNLIGGDPRHLPFGRKYVLSSKEETTNKKQYYVIDPNKIQGINLTDEELSKVIPAAREILNLKKSGRVEITHEADDDQTQDNVPY